MNNENTYWTDELVKEFMIFYNKIPYAIEGVSPILKGIELFKKSKQQSNTDYEILSIHHPDCTSNQCHQKWEFEKLFKEGWLILRVKRLPDNEVFTIDDQISEHGYYITSFELNRPSVKGITIHTCGGNYALSYVKKFKKPTPLFTTDDGKEIFEGDEYYTVSTIDFSLEKAVAINDTWEKEPNPLYEKFWNIGIAKEWIIMNKSCLSIKDICGLWVIDNTARERLKELVKQRVNV